MTIKYSMSSKDGPLNISIHHGGRPIPELSAFFYHKEDNGITAVYECHGLSQFNASSELRNKGMIGDDHRTAMMFIGAFLGIITALLIMTGI